MHWIGMSTTSTSPPKARFLYRTKRGEIFIWHFRDRAQLNRDFTRKAADPYSPFTWWDAAVCVQWIDTAARRLESQDAPQRKPR